MPFTYHKNKNDFLVIESYNYDKESNESPFAPEEKKMRMNKDVQKMVWEIR
jgi:hypothetical protein